MLPRWTLSACGKGTLQCQSNDVPSICDFTQHYVVSGSNCEVKKVDGCEIASFDTSNAPCFLCEKGKVLDEAATVCVAVDTEKEVPNCFRYDKSSSDCSECETDYFLSSGKCSPVGDIKVDNCARYSSITQCQVCDPGYYLDGNECVKIESANNCRVNTNRQCDQCMSDYFKNLGFNSNPFVANTATFELFATGQYSQTIINSGSNSTTVCEKVTVEYCKELESASACAVCQDNYFLTSQKTCQRFPESPIDNCLTYSSAVDCVLCAETHYVKQEASPTKDRCILIPTVKDCAEYNKLNGFCSLCNDGFWLNETLNSCVARNFNPPEGCETINLKADLCQACKTGYTKVTDGTGCYIDPAHCTTPVIAKNMEVGSHFCSLCNDKYYPVNGVCTLADIPGCNTYLSNRNACSECLFTHYISEAKDTCTEKDIQGCEKYTEDDEHTCEKCVKFKYLSPDKKTCTDITNINDCYYSDGKTNDCIECLPGIIRTSAGVCTGSRTATKYDTNCGGNSSIYNDSSCASCKTGYIKVGTSNLKVAKTPAEMTTLNCLKIKLDGTGCDQCKNGHQNNSGICDPDPSSTSTCLRMTQGATEALASPGTNCEECKTSLGYYVDGGACTMSTNYNTFLDCEDVSKNSALCNTCKTDTYPINPKFVICANESFTPSKFGKPGNCAVTKEFDKCAICDKEFVVSGDGSSCDSVTAGNTIMYNTFDINMNQRGSQSTADVTQCMEYAQIDQTEFVCVKCNTGFKGIIDRTKLTSSVNDLPRGPNVYYPFKKCEPEANIYQLDSGTPHISAAADCLFGDHGTGLTEGYGCLRCAAGKVGSFVQVTKDKDGNALAGAPFTFVGSCTDAASTGLRTTYSGITQNYVVNAGGYLSSSMMSFTDCATSGEVVFYIAKWSADVGIEPGLSTSDGSNANKLAFCGTEAAVLADQTQKVEHCAIYTFGITVPSTFNPASDTIATARCRSCKAGYYISEYHATNGVTECTPIHGCNTTASDNLWLNACSTPLSGGWKAAANGNLYTINYFDPMPNDSSYKINNCLAYIQSLEKCLICKPGFMPNGNACETITADNSNCTTPGMGETGMDITLASETSLAKNEFYARFSYLRKYTDGASTYANMSNSFCQTCSGSTFLATSAGTDYVCGKKIGSDKKISNCAHYNSTSCTACAANYTMKNGACVVHSADPNCAVLSGSICSSCKPGYAKDPNHIDIKCREQFCHDPAVCDMCASGKKVYNTTNKICEDNPLTTDECEHYELTNGYCVKCKEAGKIPYNLKRTYSTTLNHVTCVTSSPATNGWTGLNMEYPYVVVTNASANTYTAELFNFRTGDRVNRMYSSNIEGSPATVVCVPNRTVAACATLEYDVFCTSCEANNFLFDNNTCGSSPINKCSTPLSDRITCSACDGGYYLGANNRSCEQRVLSVNCLNATPNKDECDDCETGTYVKNSNNICVEYQAENCRTKKASVDECDFCVDNAWMDTADSNKCKLSEDAQCILMKEKENECKKCANGFYLKTNGLVQTCTQITAENCATNKSHEDKCLTCNTGYYMSGEMCVRNSEIDFCDKYSQEKDECLQCNEGYYSVDGLPECRKNPNGIAECYKYISETECSVCNTRYYLKDGTCHYIDNEISDCKYYKSMTECAECMSGYFLTSPTKCDRHNTIVRDMCNEFASHERCKSCMVNSILNEETGLCEASGISGCIKATRGSPNLCEECEPGKFLSSNKQTCETPASLISNCYEYETQTKCKKCDQHFILSLNGSTCNALGDTAGTNCGWAVETDKFQCDICEFGYNKNEIGECVKISESNCALMIGDKCGLCTPGMMMNKDGKCEDPTPPPEPISVGVIRSLSLAFLILLIFR